MTEDQTYTTISAMVDEWISDLNGQTFTTRDLWGEYNINSMLAKNYLRRILQNRVDKKILRQDGKVFRKVDRGLRKLNWQSTPADDYMQLAWPLELERWVQVYPGSICTISAPPGVGKTAFLYNFMVNNYHKHRIVLLTNDMDEEEMSQRFGYFRRHIPEDAFEVYEKWDNFGDVIEPEPPTIWLVDFLKVHNEFWKVAEAVDSIASKIGKGMAIVAIQKDQKNELGRGGTFSLETPKLYITMDFQKLKIVKARGRTKRETDPRGLEINFKLHNGTNFEELGYGWPE